MSMSLGLITLENWAQGEVGGSRMAEWAAELQCNPSSQLTAHGILSPWLTVVLWVSWSVWQQGALTYPTEWTCCRALPCSGPHSAGCLLCHLVFVLEQYHMCSVQPQL